VVCAQTFHAIAGCGTLFSQPGFKIQVRGRANRNGGEDLPDPLQAGESQILKRQRFGPVQGVTPVSIVVQVFLSGEIP